MAGCGDACAHRTPLHVCVSSRIGDVADCNVCIVGTEGTMSNFLRSTAILAMGSTVIAAGILVLVHG